MVSVSLVTFCSLGAEDCSLKHKIGLLLSVKYGHKVAGIILPRNERSQVFF